MNNIDLKGNPFYLDEKQIEWVNNTKSKMSLEEKIGQLFFLIGFTTKEKELKDVVKSIKPGGMMYRTTSVKKVSSAYRVLQGESNIPMLLAANLEAGGNGLIDEGTNFGNQLLVAASNNYDNAYKLGLVCGREAASVGANMAFAPVIDLNYNFRNPITNTRSYGDDPQKVAEMGASYVKGAHDAGLSVTIKHFPGDGADGRDQHLVTTKNSLNYKDWMATYGQAYRTSIKAGARGLMVGHITLPSYFEDVVKDRPELKDLPATLNPVLLNKLLREELGYNGLTMTDATLMTGFGQSGKRENLVPESIAAGNDMFLFTRQPQDDFKYMLNGYKNGIITEERLDEALTRILAIKASLKIHNKSLDGLVPNTFNELNIKEHKDWAAVVADEAVTLVKDENRILPLNPNKTPKIGVIYNGNESMNDTLFKNIPGFKGFVIKTVMKLASIGKKKESPVEKLVNRLKNSGFKAFHYDFGDIMSVMKDMNRPLADWKDQFDVIIYLTKWETMSNQTSLQLNYKAMGFDAPWFVEEVPTILISMANPYHGYDVPMIKTVINAYSPNDEVFKAVVDKLVGKSKFKGVSPVKLNFTEFTGDLESFNKGDK